ncbi:MULTISPECIES: substrate-binding domain-containing protein [Chromohalobacter]|jgi:tungstate transport system substrate-binding protein|uniref:substrate-binding domain-containing protein n=1 Tax=Chromohalobacter TaxID=42054 RepID=UPI000D70A43D|nr:MULTISPECIES: substrate-binding domain-containing protein [Chromohalobacter]MBZ5874797.1 substrate-binding domain-containing protein [Chromohalobacter salexigens]NQY46217.1 substrate-binding domain-containing protein [Chromohalobacter sp.]PWW41765.1 tungstate transport system substrate-binding protein [Chromohalobacter salexigens]
MLKRRLSLIAALALSCLLVSVAQAADTVRLATTTSTYNSGLLDYLLPKFEADHPYQIQVIPVGTGKALRLGRDGDVDLVLTHAPAAEKAFVDAGYGVEPHGVMYNDFVIVGPSDDPAGIAGGDDATQAFATLAEDEALFVSRGDDSGTDKKEKILWEQAGVTPDFDGFRAAGQGMGEVLKMASELQGYTLTDRGTWLAMQDKLDLEIMVEGDTQLFNPYQVILVNPERYDGLNTQGARALAEWLVSDEGQSLIDDFRLNGKVLFHASAGEDVDPESVADQE